MDRQCLICERLKKLGFTSERRIRLYGEGLQFDFKSSSRRGWIYRNDLNGKNRKSKASTRSSPVVSMLEPDLEREEMQQVA